eukprot:2770024-Rhodomonas_salina.3
MPWHATPHTPPLADRESGTDTNTDTDRERGGEGGHLELMLERARLLPLPPAPPLSRPQHHSAAHCPRLR